MSGGFQLRSRPLDARPCSGAVFDLPEGPVARRRGRDLLEDRAVLWDDVRMARLRRLHRDAPVVLQCFSGGCQCFSGDVISAGEGSRGKLAEACADGDVRLARPLEHCTAPVFSF